MAPFSAKSFVITTRQPKHPRSLSPSETGAPITTQALRRFSHDAPEDILYEVFFWATITEDPYEVRMRSPFDEGVGLPMNVRLSDEWKSSLLSRQSLPLVCKKWTDPARRFQFEHICCDHRSLAEYKEMAGIFGLGATGYLQMGRFVKSLTFVDDNRDIEKLEWATKILYGCPNLRHVRIKFSDGTTTPSNSYLEFVRTVMRFCGERLLFLDVDLGPWFDEGVMISSMHLCRNLHVLRVSSDAFGDPDPKEVVVSPALENLHTVRVTSFAQNRIRQLYHFTMSNLRHLRIFGLFDVDDALPFFFKYGRQLLSLEFTVPVPELEMLLDMCHNLRDIVISVASLILNTPGDVRISHETVSRLGVRNILLPYFTYEDITSILDDLTERLTEDFPALQLVRFVDLTPHGLNGLLQDPAFDLFWTEWMQGLHVRGVVVEDANGDELM